MLTKAQIVEVLEHLDEPLARDGVRAELYLVGGAVMCTAINARASTKDVDAWGHAAAGRPRGGQAACGH